MSTRSTHTAPTAVAFLAAILSGASQVSAQTSTVLDPAGDTAFPTPAFQDVVGARMTKTATGDFELLMEMAGPVPAAPVLPPQGRTEIWWNWVFDLDPATSPQGYPPAPGIALYPEFLVYVSWDGTEFAGTAVDRRPLLTGGEAIITAVPFTINGTILEATLSYSLIGDVPSSFVWGPSIVDWAGPVGSGGYVVPDNARTVFDPPQPESPQIGTVLLLDPPAAPSNCRTTTRNVRDRRKGDFTYTTVSWRDNASTEDGFTIEQWWQNLSGDWVLATSWNAPANSTSTSLLGRYGSNYRFRVKATNAWGDSSWSNWTR
jgi:hypothetical protein